MRPTSVFRHLLQNGGQLASGVVLMGAAEQLPAVVRGGAGYWAGTREGVVICRMAQGA